MKCVLPTSRHRRPGGEPEFLADAEHVEAPEQVLELLGRRVDEQNFVVEREPGIVVAEVYEQVAVRHFGEDVVAVLDGILEEFTDRLAGLSGLLEQVHGDIRGRRGLLDGQLEQVPEGLAGVL